MEDKIYKRFVNGIEACGLSYDEVLKWKYCGGDTKGRLKYFQQCCKGEPIPPKESHCICGHPIVENCYITDTFEGGSLLILGNCCIKRFIPKSGKTCEKCGEPHKNKKDNLCNSCRYLCKECDRFIYFPKDLENMCPSCFYKTHCLKCGKLFDDGATHLKPKLCIKCFFERERGVILGR